MSDTFSTRIAVRSYELDALGHLNQAVYHSYAEHARVEMFRRAGCGADRLISEGVSPVLLETHTRFLKELRLGDEVDVSCRLSFGRKKTFQMDSTLRRTDDAVACEMTATLGLLDLATRRLLEDPRKRLEAVATDPGFLNANGQ
jgi:acyl-CoA thioester hydrolase